MKDKNDHQIEHTRDRWNALVDAGIQYSRPFLNMSKDSAKEFLDPFNRMPDVKGKDVLCLAGGGGQQSVAFGLLGATVTVFDLSDKQLEGDIDGLAHHGLTARIEQGDMRDLSRFGDNSFDLIYHAWSINFIPDPLTVLGEVSRVLRPGGLYRIQFANPFYGITDERDWNGEGYVIKHPYQDGLLPYDDDAWEVTQEDGSIQKVEGPKEYNHTLGTMINGLIGEGFILLGLWEEALGDPTAEPGTFDHFLTIAPRDITVWARLAG